MSEPLIFQNLIKSIGREVGFKDPLVSEDFVLGYTPLDIQNNGSETDDFKDIRGTVTVDAGDIDKLSPKLKELLPKAVNFFLKTARRFQIDMRLLMDYYAGHQGKNIFTDDMIQKMISKGYDVPRFEIKGPEQSRVFLSNNKIVDYRLNPDHTFTTIFNLPAPLARFWYRGGTEFWG